MSKISTHQKKHVQNNQKTSGKSRELVIKQDGEEYATIKEAVGNNGYNCVVIKDNTVVNAKARGCLISGPKKQRIGKGDMVLIQLDSSTSGKAKYYILHKYTPDHVKLLQKGSHLKYFASEEKDMNSVIFDSDHITKKNEIVIDDDFISSI